MDSSKEQLNGSDVDRSEELTQSSSSSIGEPFGKITDATGKDLESGVSVADLVHVEKAETPTVTEIDPNLVDWDGPSDPENPRNWSIAVKITQLALISVIALMADVAPSMFAPAYNIFLDDFHIKNKVLQSLIITIYLLGFSAGPLICAPMSELYGRRIVYRGCIGLFVISSLVCSFSPNVAVYLVFFLACGCAASGPLTIHGGTVVDVVRQERRGVAMALVSLGPLIGPFIGPVTGGFVAQRYGWRWIFHIITIFGGILFILSILIMRESNPAVILNHKIALIRKGNGNQNLRTKYDQGISTKALLRRAIIRPLKLLIFSPVILAMSTYGAITMALTVMLYTTVPMIFYLQYGLSSGDAGLAYMGFGVGMILGVGAFSLLSDRMLKSQAKGGLMKPEYRLPLMIYASAITPIGFFLYGWSAQIKAHYMVPIIGTAMLGFGFINIIMSASLYLVDAFGPYAASALAAVSVMRSILGTFLPLAGPQMFFIMGVGWGNTVLGFVTLACLSIPWFLYRYGEKMRTRWVIRI